MSLPEISENYGRSQGNGKGSEKGGDFRSLTIKVVDNTFMQKQYERQEASITDPDSFRCPFCPQKIFERATNLINHLQSHNPNYVTSVEFPLTSSSLSETKSKKCPGNENLTSKDDASRYHVCIFCLRTCARKQNFEDHIRYHIGEKPFHCRFCKKQYPSRDALRKHLLSQHQTSLVSRTKRSQKLNVPSHIRGKPFKCTTCSRSFDRPSHLGRHNLIHTRGKGFLCNFCPEAFARKDSLKRHLLIHANRKPHRCALCSKRFRLHQTLKVHALTHTRKTPYKCHLCSYECKQSSNLKRHLKNVHKV